MINIEVIRLCQRQCVPDVCFVFFVATCLCVCVCSGMSGRGKEGGCSRSSLLFILARLSPSLFSSFLPSLYLSEQGPEQTLISRFHVIASPAAPSLVANPWHCLYETAMCLPCAPLIVQAAIAKYAAATQWSC